MLFIANRDDYPGSADHPDHGNLDRVGLGEPSWPRRGALREVVISNSTCAATMASDLSSGDGGLGCQTLRIR